MPAQIFKLCNYKKSVVKNVIFFYNKQAPPQPTTTEVPQPETTEVAEPATTEVPLPETTEVQQPATTEVAQPATTEVPQPETTEVAQPETTEDPQPHTTEVPQPETTEVELTTPEPTVTQCKKKFFSRHKILFQYFIFVFNLINTILGNSRSTSDHNRG